MDQTQFMGVPSSFSVDYQETPGFLSFYLGATLAQLDLVLGRIRDGDRLLPYLMKPVYR
jgi:hypothetical protein